MVAHTGTAIAGSLVSRFHLPFSTAHDRPACYGRIPTGSVFSIYEESEGDDEVS
jgi:hypothetical protein